MPTCRFWSTARRSHSFALLTLLSAFLSLATLALTVPPAACAQVPRYTITGLGNLGTDSSGIGSSGARAINNSGQVVGSSDVVNASGHRQGSDAFLYSNGRMTDLGNLGTDGNGFFGSEAYGINNAGQVVGNSLVAADNTVGSDLGQDAFLYNNGRMLDLGNFGTDGSGQGQS